MYCLILGRKIYKTSYPIPKSGATISQVRDVVICRGGFEANLHHFYLGTSMETVEMAGMDDAEFQFSLDNGRNMFQLGSLEVNTSYFWRVDAQNMMGHVYKGDVWELVTGSLGRTPI